MDDNKIRFYPNPGTFEMTKPTDEQMEFYSQLVDASSVKVEVSVRDPEDTYSPIVPKHRRD
jgi:hypothetical protein